MKILSKLFNIVSAPLAIREELRVANALLRDHVRRIEKTLVLQEIDRLRSNPRYQNEKCLMRCGYKIYSQNDEDGLIREIFNRVGVTNKLFVEFGVGDGLENNSLALLFDGWSGLWIEGSGHASSRIQENFTNTLRSGRLKLIHSFITKDNIDGLISSAISEKEIDFLSIDIDGNDFHIFKAISCISARVVAIEYNAKFRPPIQYCMDYDESYGWNLLDDCFGASLKSLEILFKEKGYCLVGCNLLGINAFFVREDLVEDKFLEPFSAEHHYEPARYDLSAFPSGHRPAYEALEKSMILKREKSSL